MAQTPPISPDGNYWWNGQSWQPMPAHAAAPPAQPAAAAKPEWLDQAPTWLASPPGSAAPEPSPPVVAEPVAAPAWNTPAPGGSRKWIYLTGTLLLVVIAITAVYVRGQLAYFQTSSAQVAATTPTPLISDYEQADRFINVDLAPSLTAAVGPLQKVGSSCTMTGMPPSCKDALIATNKAMLATEDVLDQGHIPACIARQVQQFKYDWQGMEQGVSQAISGFVNGNNIDLYRQGMVKFAEIAQYVQPDMDRITAAEKTCPKTIP